MTARDTQTSGHELHDAGGAGSFGTTESREAEPVAGAGRTAATPRKDPNDHGRARDIDAWLEAHRVDVSGLHAEDIVGIGHVTAEVDSLVARLRDPQRAEAMGVESPRGLLFWGDPGLGKTLVARSVAVGLGSDVPFYEVSADELTPARIRGAMVELARRHPRSVLYIDEIDTFGMTRDYQGHDPKTRLLLTATLAALDGLRPTAGPLVIASSNREPRHLDRALLRAGRLGFQVRFDRPKEVEREALLRLFARGIPCAPRMGWRNAARLTRRATPADLRQLVADAAGLALAAGRDRMTAADLRVAIRRSGRIEPEETVLRDWPRMAVHEAGHVAVAVALRGADWVYAVKLGVAGGETSVGDDRLDSTDWPDDELVDRFAVGMGGLVAEQLVLGAAGRGAGADITSRTELGLERFGAGLSGETPVDPDQFSEGKLPESIKEAMGRATVSAIADGRARAESIVAENAEAIRHFATALAAAGELTGRQLAHAIAEAGFSEPSRPEKAPSEGDPQRKPRVRRGRRSERELEDEEVPGEAEIGARMVERPPARRRHLRRWS